MFQVKLYRSPDTAEMTGSGVIEDFETAPADEVSPEAQKPDTEKNESKPQEVAKEKTTDWDRYQKMNEKFERNPNAKITKTDLELQRKYEGKDESTIEGYSKRNKETQDDDEVKPTKSKADDTDEKAVEADPDEPLLKMVGAKDKSQLAAKVTGLVNEVKKLAGERGEIGRVLKEVGVSNLKALADEIKGARSMHQALQDAKSGNTRALEFLGLTNNQARKIDYDGEIPESVLDEGLFKHIAPQLKAANERADRLERELRSMQGKLEPWEKSQAETQAHTMRQSQLSAIVQDVTAVMDSVDGLWDSKKSGSLSKAVNDYYSDANYSNPDFNPVAEIIQIAIDHDLKGRNGFELALASWERKNQGSLIAKARQEGRDPFLNKKPTIGLSDRQGTSNGSFKTYTEQSVRDMALGKIPVPLAWKDSQGNIVREKVPTHLRHLATFEE